MIRPRNTKKTTSVKGSKCYVSVRAVPPKRQLHDLPHGANY